MKEEKFYRVFEDRWRGSRELVADRLKVYLPFMLPVLSLYEKPALLDLGCGRGEWLELMAGTGFSVLGADLDEGMLSVCAERNLPAERKDFLVALKETPSGSQSVVTGFHIAEHLPFEILLELVKESLRVLKPGGLFILESPNPENIVVGTADFYLDPTHLRPLPPGLLAFLPEYYGFERTKILRLQESPDLVKSRDLSLRAIIHGVSPDFAVIAQKKAPSEVLTLFDGPFGREYGVTMEALCSRFDANLEERFSSVERVAGSAIEEAKLAEAGAERAWVFAEQARAMAENAEVLARNAERRAAEAEIFARHSEVRAAAAGVTLEAVMSSRSWRMTAPYRALGDLSRSSKEKTGKIMGTFLMKLRIFILTHPSLKRAALSLVRKFPGTAARLRTFHEKSPVEENLHEDGNLSAVAGRIYSELKAEIERQKEVKG